jgi:undecaprenyl pyrophosphate synthase
LFVPIQTGALETKQTYSQPVLTELQPNNTQANFSSKLQELETKLEQITSALNNLTEKIAQNSLQTETNKDELNSQVQEQTELNDLNVTGASNGTESEVEVIEEEKKLEDSINSAVKEQEEETTNQLSEQEDKLKLLKVSNYDLYAECYENAKEIFDYLDDKQLKVAALSLYQATYKRRNHNSLEGAYSVE